MARAARGRAGSIRECPMNLRNELVSFRISDLHAPEKDWVLRRKYGEVELQGRLVAEVPDPTSQIIYGVVEVDGLDRHLMVPRERIVFHGVEPDPFTVT
jgi:hypothetical protein